MEMRIRISIHFVNKIAPGDFFLKVALLAASLVYMLMFVSNDAKNVYFNQQPTFSDFAALPPDEYSRILTGCFTPF